MKKTSVSRVGHSENALDDFRIVDPAGAANCRSQQALFCPRMLNDCPAMSNRIAVRQRHDS
jgi:hypothetical protein